SRYSPRLPMPPTADCPTIWNSGRSSLRCSAAAPTKPWPNYAKIRCEPLQNLARMCARWADDVADLIRDHDPNMGGLINRVADNCSPLFAIADMIGDDWPARARDAAASLMPKEVESIGPMLLEDIKAVFDAKNTDRLSSEDICEALAGMEGRPWAEYGKS